MIDSALLEKDNDYNNMMDNENFIDNKKFNKFNTNNNNDIFIYNNANKYNTDNDEFDNYLIEIENKKNKLFKKQIKINKKLFNQEEIFKKLKNIVNNYENKINNNKNLINQIKYNNVFLKSKKEIIHNTNNKIIPIIKKVKESKDLENNIINIILKNSGNNKTPVKINIIENNIQKYNKNLMIKILKNIIQSNYNLDLYLNNDYNHKLKYICKKYNIFNSIIEDLEE